MFLKTQLKKAKLPLHRLFLSPQIRRFCEQLLVLKNAVPIVHRSHPIDAFYGIDTSGFVPVDFIHKDPAFRTLIHPYVGSPPSLTRAALSSLPDISSHRFADLGCGKGRVLIVASDFPFKEIIGIELAPELVKIARDNVKKVTSDFSKQTPMRIIEGNLLDYFPAEGKVVLYFYHPIGRELTAELAAKIETALKDKLEHVFIIYHNPVWGDIFDASPALKRWSAETIVLDATETKTTRETHDNFVIWQSLRNAYPGTRPGADRKIIFCDELRAELA